GFHLTDFCASGTLVPLWAQWLMTLHPIPMLRNTRGCQPDVGSLSRISSPHDVRQVGALYSGQRLIYPTTDELAARRTIFEHRGRHSAAATRRERRTCPRWACGGLSGSHPSVETQEARQRPSIQNDSGLSQGRAGRSVLG